MGHRVTAPELRTLESIGKPATGAAQANQLRPQHERRLSRRNGMPIPVPEAVDAYLLKAMSTFVHQTHRTLIRGCSEVGTIGGVRSGLGDQTLR